MVHWKACGGKSQEASLMRRSIIREMVTRGIAKTEIAAVFNMTRRAVQKAALMLVLSTLFALYLAILTLSSSVTSISLIAPRGHGHSVQSYEPSIEKNEPSPLLTVPNWSQLTRENRHGSRSTRIRTKK